ncbi:carbonic anhydrase family protein [Aspergillus brunneoviolaceus CBS 621.78]|uniref:Carbonic anhydrase n=1 Tax=Aspergillus brunneoviolaceus CBS 621.78 TaxID=1450534 RepID=A0ACD1GB00_9EURO|nr:carbonic anhydrase [Aspergillus brunneoviolaceus CBS 621.78]RAH46291.1 carbonic anhydrase [Aspergillus brunneoviolaceus CBS 621.78]
MANKQSLPRAEPESAKRISKLSGSVGSNSQNSHYEALEPSSSGGNCRCLLHSGYFPSPPRCRWLVAINSYNYTNLGGPLTWYGLNNETNAACSQGKHQSPIDIVTAEIDYVPTGSLRFNIPATTAAKFENLGSGLEVVLTNGTLSVGNSTQYKLAQFHFHTPSEHRINEEYFPLESHFVFEDSESNIAVVGFLFQLSETGVSFPLFDAVFAHIDDIATPGTFTETGPLDFAGLTAHLDSHGIYQYDGSLTPPPLQRGSCLSYNKVKQILKFNARYTQTALGADNLLEVAAHELY